MKKINESNRSGDSTKLNRTVNCVLSKSFVIVQSNYCSIFQAKVIAIPAAVGFIADGNVYKQNITVPFDNQAAIRALNFNVMNSKTIYGYCRFLNAAAERYESYEYPGAQWYS